MPKSNNYRASGVPHERAIWRGSISFGLVQIPIGLFRAESDNELHFTMLDKRDHAPVHFERKNGLTGKPIKWNDIVKGYAICRDEYIVMTDEDFANANVKATGGIDIISFVDAADVDPLFYNKPYYMLPEDKSHKTYVLLREALNKTKKVGVAKIVIRTRQHLALVRVYGEALMLELLRFPHELRPISDLTFPAQGTKAAGISPSEVKMATSLVDSMTAAWDPSAYTDSYHDDLLAIIKRKKRQGGATSAAAPKKPAKKKTDVVDIVELLQRSVAAQNPPKKRDKNKTGPVKKKKGRAAHKAARTPRRAR